MSDDERKSIKVMFEMKDMDKTSHNFRECDLYESEHLKDVMKSSMQRHHGYTSNQSVYNRDRESEEAPLGIPPYF